MKSDLIKGGKAMRDKLVNILETIKMQGNYAVTLYYGEDIGCDDMDVPVLDRKATVVVHPVGCLGGMRKVWRGKVKELLKFDFAKEKPVVVGNPPSKEEQENRYYVFGTPDAMATYGMRRK